MTACILPFPGRGPDLHDAEMNRLLRRYERVLSFDPGAPVMTPAEWRAAQLEALRQHYADELDDGPEAA